MAPNDSLIDADKALPDLSNRSDFPQWDRTATKQDSLMAGEKKIEKAPIYNSNRTFDIAHIATAVRAGEEPESPQTENNSSAIVVLPGESIQAAIDMASPGDVIEVQSGTYRENIDVDKPLIIRGLDAGSGLPTVDAGGKSNAVKVSADQVMLEGLNVTNSSKRGIDEPGAGIKVASNNCTIEGIVAFDNYYGISLKNSNNNTISESNLSYNERGIRLYLSNNNTVIGNKIAKCTYPIEMILSDNNLIENNSFINNSKSIKIDESSKENKIVGSTEDTIPESKGTKDSPHIPAGMGNMLLSEPPAQTNAASGKSDDDGEGMPLIDANRGTSETPSETATEELQRHIDEEVKRLPWGQIAFTPPEKMSKDKTYPVVVRISRNLLENVTEGLGKFERVETEQIKVSCKMNAKLDGGSSFKILPETQEPKILQESGYAEWTWEVTPLEEGTHVLKLTVMAMICLGKGEYENIENKVFEREIVVNVDQVGEIKTFFIGNAMWIAGLFTTTLIVAIINMLSGGIIERLKSIKKK